MNPPICRLFLKMSRKHNRRGGVSHFRRIAVGVVPPCRPSSYQAHQEVNTWPLNRKVLVEIWATQTFMGSQVIATWNLISQVF